MPSPQWNVTESCVPRLLTRSDVFAILKTVSRLAEDRQHTDLLRSNASTSLCKSSVRRARSHCRAVLCSRADRFESAAGLESLIRAAEADAWLSLGLAAVLNSLPLSAQLSQVSGSLWSRVLQVSCMGRWMVFVSPVLLHNSTAGGAAGSGSASADLSGTPLVLRPPDELVPVRGFFRLANFQACLLHLHARNNQVPRLPLPPSPKQTDPVLHSSP